MQDKFQKQRNHHQFYRSYSRHLVLDQHQHLVIQCIHFMCPINKHRWPPPSKSTMTSNYWENMVWIVSIWTTPIRNTSAAVRRSIHRLHRPQWETVVWIDHRNNFIRQSMGMQATDCNTWMAVLTALPAKRIHGQLLTEPFFFAWIWYMQESMKKKMERHHFFFFFLICELLILIVNL